ncbi:MAG TPA: alpha/beta hydrolase [Chloroflexia bacterium]|nr:alpha/beta hydrolase [Chloroflexia bacterium]
MHADRWGYAPVEHGELYYEVSGTGPALVFIHAGVADHTMWSAQVEEFARDHTVVTYDSRGFGQSRTEDTSFSNRQDVADLMKHLGIEKAVIVGCSRGGQIALDFALESPEKVSGLVWVCGGVSGMDEAFTPDESQWFAQLEELWAAQDWERLSDLETQTWTNGVGQPADRTPPAMRAQVRAWVYDSYTRKDGESSPRVLQPPAAGRLGEVKCPVLVLVGDLDTTIVRAAADLLASSLPDARKVVFSNAAHLPNLEQPVEFNETVRAFLEEHKH